MMDFEKNKLYLDTLGIERVKALCKEAGEEAIYPQAIFHVWQVETIKEGLAANKDLAEIAQEVGMSLRSVQRWAERLSDKI